MTSVYGFFGTLMQRRIEMAHKMNDLYQLGKEGEINKAAKTFASLTADFVTYVIWPTAVEEWVTGQTTEDRRGWGAHLLSAATMGAFMTIPYIRDLVHGAIEGKAPDVGMAAAMFHDFGNAARTLMKGRDAFTKENAGKAVQRMLTLANIVSGRVPGGKLLANSARFAIDQYNRQQAPKRAHDWFLGITRGDQNRRVVR